MSGSRVTRIFARVGEQTTSLVTALLGLGLRNLAWPLAIGATLGSLLLTAWPGLATIVHKKYGGAVVVALMAFFVLGGCMGVSWRQRREPDAWLRTSQWLQRLGIPVLLGPIVVALGNRLEAKQPFLVLALSLAGAWVVARWLRSWLSAPEGAEQVLREREDDHAVRREPRPALFALGGLVLLYTVTFSVLAIRNHLSFNTGRADLGFYVSIFRRSSLGDPLGCTICGGGNHLSGHFDPILVLLSPLYLLYPEAETVLVLQSLLLGSSMVPLYLLARHYGVTALSSLIVCLCFGLHPALHGINLFDFHSLALLVPAAMWLLWARDTERHKTYWALVLVLLSVREDAALVLVFIAADTILRGGKRAVLRGIGTIVLSSLYFVAVKAFLMSGADPLDPGGSGGGYAYYYRDLVPKGTGTMGLVTSVLSRPHEVLTLIASEEKVEYWLKLLLPVLALPLLARRGRLLLLYGAAFTLLASRKFVYSTHFHYSSVVIPFLFYLAVVALSRPRRSARLLTPLIGRGLLTRPKLQLLLAVTMLSATALASWRFGAILPNRTFHAGFRPLQRNPGERDLERDRALKEICRTVPKGAIVAANEPNLPHLGRCAGYYQKKRRLKADYLAWAFSKSGVSSEIRREIRLGYWKEAGTFGPFELLENVAPSDVRAGKKKRVSRPTSKKPKRQRKAKSRVPRASDAGSE